jgi:hypothetical protein
MASEAKRPDIYIFRDDEGHYYAISQETLESWRVPEELKDTAAALTSESEVSGYTGPRFQVLRFKSLEDQSRMQNFEIQRLMSAYNQAETLASSVRKKHDDTASGIVGKF